MQTDPNRRTDDHSDRSPKPLRLRKYGFFAFRTSERMAGEYGVCTGMVNYQTGEFHAGITYGLLLNREEYRGNISNEANIPPICTTDQIILAARKTARLKGEKQVTRRRVIYVRRNGSRYITEEFNGDRAEYAAHTQHIDSCDFDWTEIRSILSRAKTYTEFIKANLEVQASYHSFLKEHGNSGVVRCLRKGRETPLADSLLVIYERPLATGGRSFETDYVCFNPDPDNPYPACLGLKGKEKCTGCKFRHYTQEEQKKQMKGLSEQFGWPEAVHIDGLDVYLCAATKQQDGVEEHTPVYRMPYRDRPVEDWRWRSSKEFYRLRAALEKDPCALASQSDQFQTCPPDWYRELALHAMWALTKTYGAGHFNRSRCDAASQAARSVTKAVFGEQTLFDPYTDQSFLTAAGYLLPTYIRRYTESKRDAETVGEAKNNEH